MNLKNLFNKKKIQKARAFWTWFASHQSKYLFVNQVDREELEMILDEFLCRLHEYDEHLFFQIGGHPEAERIELVITAEGHVKHFPAVERLVEQAPDFEHWEVIAFKPPMGADFTTACGGYNFDPHATLFIPLQLEEDPAAVAIRVCYADYKEEERSTFLLGTYLMLDTILGEKSAALDIAYLEVVRTPDDIGAYSFRHLSDIRAYIEEVKNG